MLTKLLLLAAVIAAVYYFFFKPKPLPKKDDAKPASDSEETVECAACGTYVSLADAIVSNGKYYCSKECLNR